MGCTIAPKSLECMAMLAERNSLAAIHRIKGTKEEIVIVWLHKAPITLKRSRPY